METREGEVVQDAERLDAMGAIGIARPFAYGGRAGQSLHDPNAVPEAHETPEAYSNAQVATLQHRSEKLLLLADRMHTATARRTARERHEFMEAFVARFLAEWEGTDRTANETDIPGP